MRRTAAALRGCEGRSFTLRNGKVTFWDQQRTDATNGRSEEAQETPANRRHQRGALRTRAELGFPPRASRIAPASFPSTAKRDKRERGPASELRERSSKPPMTATAVTAAGSTPPATIPERKPRELMPTGKVRAAIGAMVWDGLKRGDAAAKAGLKEHSLYVALSKAHVKRYYLDQLEVLRTSERARNIHALVEVREQTGNAMARVNAVKTLEQIADSPTNSVAARVPGLIVQIIGNGAVTTHQREIEVKPLIDHAAGGDDDA